MDIKKLTELAQQGTITRREFMSQAIAAGVTVAAASTMFSSAQAATPKKGGHFKIAIGAGSTTDSLDPGTYPHTFAQQLAHSRLGYLMEINEKSEAIPELAESLEPSPDAKVWTVKLRKDVTFHGGKTLDADDVVASMNHHRGEDSKSAAKSLLTSVTDIKADGKHTVVFTLSGGNADFPYILTDYHLAMLPAKDGKIDPHTKDGTGGYMLENWEPGVKAELKRYPGFWKEGRAHFDSLEILSIKDVAARTNALATGEVHAMDRCDLKTVHLLKRNKNIKIEQVTGTQHYSIPMIMTQAPFDNNDVRLALKYAIDRKTLVDTILRGYGAVANDHPISPANPNFNKDLAQRQYDPDKAKHHLKKAGMSSLKVDLSAADAAFAGAVDAAVLYKEHAAKAGIDINVVREPSDGYWSNVWMKKPWCMCYWGGRPTEDWMFTAAYAEESKWNDTFWKHERFNKLLLEARAELDKAKRREMYYEMQAITSNEGGVVIPMYASYVYATSSKIAHGPLASNWDLDGNMCTERWWFA